MTDTRSSAAALPRQNPEYSGANLVLIGMMGSGKTTCGRLLAQQLGRELVDADILLQQREGRSIPEIFAAEGEGYFRDLESAIARELSQRSNLVVATGGGIILRPENVQALRETGVVVWLNRPADHIFDAEDLGDRPLAQGGKAAFLKTFAAREARYRQAAHIIIEDFSSPQATVAEIIKQWRAL